MMVHNPNPQHNHPLCQQELLSMMKIIMKHSQNIWAVLEGNSYNYWGGHVPHSDTLCDKLAIAWSEKTCQIQLFRLWN